MNRALGRMLAGSMGTDHRRQYQDRVCMTRLEEILKEFKVFPGSRSGRLECL